MSSAGDEFEFDLMELKFNYSRWFYPLSAALSHVYSLYAFDPFVKYERRTEEMSKKQKENSTQYWNLMRKPFISKCIIKTLCAPQNNR